MSLTLIFLIIITVIAALVSLASLALYFLDSKFTSILRNFGSYFSSLLLFLVAFVVLIPESSERLGIGFSFLVAFIAFIVFFLVVHICDAYYRRGSTLKPHHPIHRRTIFIICLLKNICDAVIVGATFTLSFSAGIAATTAITAYEIPQKISDAATLKRNRYPKRKIILSLALISFTLPIFATITWLVLCRNPFASYLVAAASGIFTYLAFRAINSVAKKLQKD